MLSFVAVDGFLNLPDGRRVPVRDGLTLGRVGCDVVLDDTKASRRHARLCVQGTVVEIEDLGSSNGTLLNGKPVQRRMLRDGDEVQIGTTILVFREQAGTAPAPPAAAPAAPAVAPMSGPEDLFDDDEDEGIPAPAPPQSAAPPPQSAASSPRATPPPRASVVEFADEVVQVRPPSRPAAPPAAAAPPAGDTLVQQKQRVLQFSRSGRPGRGMLADDLGQMSPPARALVYGLVLAGAGVVVWLLVSFLR